MYWAPGAAHGPHHIFKEWADKYKGKFDDGWDAYRERVFKRQKDIGWIPANTQLTPRADTMASWDSIPEAQRPFQRRLMEVFAGFVEHVDAQVGRLVDGLEEMGVRDNTIIFYVFGDNGSSAEGQNGTISELLAQNMIPNTIEQQIAALDKIGGLDVLGSAKTDNMYHAGWAWAGDTPYRYTKLIASYFGGTRNPLVVSWPKGIKPDKTPRPQFHHVNDIVPTIYDILGDHAAEVVNGIEARPDRRRQHDLRLRPTAKAPGRKKTQYFENNGSRAIYQRRMDGRRPSDPLIPWQCRSRFRPRHVGRANKDHWELLRPPTRHSRGRSISPTRSRPPRRRQEAVPSRRPRTTRCFPIGAALWTRLHPEDRVKSPYTHWDFNRRHPRCPEFAAPGLGREGNRVVVDAEYGARTRRASFMRSADRRRPDPLHGQGQLVYEYNMMMIERYIARRADRARKASDRGRHLDRQPAAPADVDHGGRQGTMRVAVKRTVAGAFSASETLDVGVDLGSPVSFDYFDRRPFAFTGKIGVTVDLK